MSRHDQHIRDEPLVSGAQDPYIGGQFGIPRPAVVRCIGPEGSYSWDFTQRLFGSVPEWPSRDDGWMPPRFFQHTTFSEVESAVVHDHSIEPAYGVLPVENSSRTMPVHAISAILFKERVQAIAEGSLLVKLCLASTADSLDSVRTVYSMSTAFGQAEETLDELDVQRHEVESTSLAAEMVAELGKDAVAALCSVGAARRYGLKVLESDVQDDPSNKTRFIVVKANEGLAEPDLSLLVRGGRLSNAPTVKTIGILSPTLPEAKDGFYEATTRLRNRDIHPSVPRGYMNGQKVQAGGDGEYLIDLTATPQRLYDLLANPNPNETMMFFRSMGIFAVGSTYRSID